MAALVVARRAAAVLLEAFRVVVFVLATVAVGISAAVWAVITVDVVPTLVLGMQAVMVLMVLRCYWCGRLLLLMCWWGRCWSRQCVRWQCWWR